MNDRPEFVWPTGASTGVGSMPGTEPRESAQLVLDAFPDLPHLVELPRRGAGADLIGRTAALLPDLPVATVPTGWAITDRPGPDTRRALAWLDEDLDVLEELADGYDGALKISLAGPLTLAAGIELRGGERLLRDHGAVRDLTSALTDTVRTHVADVQRRVPGARIVLQFDEPSLPAALAARIRTASGLATLRRVDVAVAEGLLREVFTAAVDAGATPVVHSCAPDVPVALLRRAGARGVSLDVSLLPRSDAIDEALGECVEAGVTLLLGVVPTDGSGPSEGAGSVRVVRELWHRLGFAPALLAPSVVVTPACGLAGASPSVARDVMTRVSAAARTLVDDPEG